TRPARSAAPPRAGTKSRSTTAQTPPKAQREQDLSRLRIGDSPLRPQAAPAGDSPLCPQAAVTGDRALRPPDLSRLLGGDSPLCPQAVVTGDRALRPPDLSRLLGGDSPLCPCLRLVLVRMPRPSSGLLTFFGMRAPL